MHAICVIRARAHIHTHKHTHTHTHKHTHTRTHLSIFICTHMYLGGCRTRVLSKGSRRGTFLAGNSGAQATRPGRPRGGIGGKTASRRAHAPPRVGHPLALQRCNGRNRRRLPARAALVPWVHAPRARQRQRRWPLRQRNGRWPRPA